MGSCGECLAKFGLISFNILFLVSGIAVLGVGIWVKVDKNIVSMQHLVSLDTSDKSLDTAGWVLIGVGVFVLLVSALGFLAAVKPNRFFTISYILFLIIICAGEMAGGITAAVFKGKVEGELKTILNDTLHAKYTEGDNVGAKAWDYIQVWLKCCGAFGPKDYREVNFTDVSQHVPKSCCVLSNNDGNNPNPKDNTKCQEEAAKNTTSSTTYLHNTGCYSQFEEQIKSHLALVIGVGVGVAMLEILGVVLACFICLGQKNNDFPA